MSLQINLQAPAKPFVAGGPMPLVLSLRNTGDSGEEVPASIGPSQFEYLLLTENGEDTIENISYRTKELSRGHQLVLKPNLQLLAPGKAALYRNDLADLAIQPIGPGKYQVEALYRLPGNVLLRSNRVAIEVIASRPSQSIQGLDSRGANLDAFEFHNEDTGESVLRHWQSPLSNPLQGKFQHLHSVREPVSHLAMALEAEPQDSDMGQWRWVAWTSADTVCAEVARAVDVKYPSGGLASGLSSLTLFAYGYQFAEGDGLFLLTGIGPNGRRGIRLLALPADEDLSPQFLEVPLPVVPDVPAMATFYSKPANPEDAESRPAHQLALSWVLQIGNAWGFAMARLDPGTGAVIAAPRSIFTTNRSITAYTIPPVIFDEISNSFAFLLAPPEEGGTFTRITLDARDPSRREEWNLPAFEGPSGVQQWILPFAHTPAAPVAAVASHRLWVASPGGASWKDTQLDVRHAASAVRLWSLPTDEYWCTWFDTAQGFQLHRVA